MTSPDRTSVRRVEVTPMRGTHVQWPPGRENPNRTRPFADPQVEIFRVDPEWFAPWVDEIDLGEIGFLRREAAPRRRREPLPFQLARRILRDTPMQWEMPPREPGFVAHLRGVAQPFGIQPGMYIGRTLAHGTPVRIMADDLATQFRPSDVGNKGDQVS